MISLLLSFLNFIVDFILISFNNCFNFSFSICKLSWWCVWLNCLLLSLKWHGYIHVVRSFPIVYFVSILFLPPFKTTVLQLSFVLKRKKNLLYVIQTSKNNPNCCILKCLLYLNDMSLCQSSFYLIWFLF